LCKIVNAVADTAVLTQVASFGFEFHRTYIVETSCSNLGARWNTFLEHTERAYSITISLNPKPVNALKSRKTTVFHVIKVQQRFMMHVVKMKLICKSFVA